MQELPIGASGQHTVLKVQDPIAALCSGLVMRYHQQGMPASARQPEEAFEDVAPGGFVQIPGWFIRQDHGGIIHEGARQRDALLLTAGQFHRPVLSAVLEANLFDQIQRTEPGLRAPACPPAQCHGRQKYILQDRHLRQEMVGLKDKTQARGANLRASPLPQTIQIIRRDPYPPGFGTVKPAQHVKQRTLARAAHAGHRHGFTRLHR